MNLFERVLCEASKVYHTDPSSISPLRMDTKVTIAQRSNFNNRVATFDGPTAEKDAVAWIKKAGFKKSLDGGQVVWKLKASAAKKAMNAAAKKAKTESALKSRQFALWGGEGQIAKIKSALTSFVRHQGFQHQDAVFEFRIHGKKGYSSIRAEFRSNDLPKEGAYEMGYHDYDELVGEVKKHVRKSFKSSVASYLPNNAVVSISAGEKSWIEFHIDPPKTKPRGFGKPKMPK